MSLLITARASAALVSLGTLGFLAVGGGFRLDNPFLVPDVVISLLLLASAVLPGTAATTPLLASFSAAAGVLATAVATNWVRGQLGLGALIATVVSVLMAALLITQVRLPNRDSSEGSRSGFLKAYAARRSPS